jgi:peptide deformylase
MSDTTLDTLIIDTGGATPVKEVRVEPLPLYDENHPMLKVQIPDYKAALPNPIMELLIKRLKMTMKLYGGIGLSANQCGVFERVFVIGTDQFQIACVNPRIVAKSPSTIKSEEGCLSYPGLFVKIDRPDWIDVEFTDETGTLKQMRLEGVTARCFQHELDHMNGIRMVEHVGPVALQMARKKQDKIIKKIVRNKKK